MITISLNFSEDEVSEICTAIHMGDEDLGNKLFKRLKKKPKLLKRFTAELQATPFVEELVENSYESCANDWMCEFNIEE